MAAVMAAASMAVGLEVAAKEVEKGVDVFKKNKKKQKW